MNINGNIVILRALEESDNDMLLSLINDPETEAMVGGSSFPVSEKQQRDWLSNNKADGRTLRCAIAIKNDIKKSVGTVLLTDIDMKNATAEFHIKLCSEARGKGYAKDATNALVKYAFFELRLQCVYSEVLEFNIASQQLLEKCGFTLDGILRSRIFKNGKFVNVHSYSITNS